MIYKTIVYQKSRQVACITLNRPEAANTINLQMAMEIEEACQRINGDEDTTVVVLTGAGGEAFCSGEDFNQISDTVSDDALSPDALKEFTLRYNVSAMVGGIRCPVVAAINGEALGAGLALALSCDVRVASSQALFGVPDLARGYFLANGITQLLPRIVGRGKAMELILTTETVDASEALRIGLIHRIAPHHEVFSEAEKLAGDIASKAPLSLRYIKEAVNKGLDLTLEQGLGLECDLYMILHTTHDRTEGVKAFREKRQPSFVGE
ncbi:MAG: hypothetical protein A2Y91_00840 [Chloroflexi bacterium RBG_13_54_8]|nr:MAG: hypothetical protein A2Y91_00840 [Chloroflexi bacterium RBG_13_54_8]